MPYYCRNNFKVIYKYLTSLKVKTKRTRVTMAPLSQSTFATLGGDEQECDLIRRQSCTGTVRSGSAVLEYTVR